MKVIAVIEMNAMLWGCILICTHQVSTEWQEMHTYLPTQEVADVKDNMPD